MAQLYNFHVHHNVKGKSLTFKKPLVYISLVLLSKLKKLQDTKHHGNHGK